MRKFLKRFALFVLLFVGVHILLIVPVPADRNQYLQAYNHKIGLLQTTARPRLIFMGGSNTAFGISSPMIEDSLGLHVINFGLHGGIGIRYPMEDALQYIRRGDIVVLQLEYANYFGETCNAETMPKLMVATGWRRAAHLRLAEWRAVIGGLPMLALGNLKRLVLWPFRGTLDTPVPTSHFKYTAGGFNAYGDEVSHLNFPTTPHLYTRKKDLGPVDQGFCRWLRACLKSYEQHGARIVMLPPSCTESCLSASYSADIAEALSDIGYPYAVQPQEMTVADSLAFDSGYHLNAEGVRLNSQKIILILDRYITRGCSRNCRALSWTNASPCLP